MKIRIETPQAPQPNGMPYSQGITAGNLIFTAGQIPLTPDGKKIDGPIEDQVRQVMHNLQEILKAAGADFPHVVKTTIYLTDMSLYKKVNEIYGSFLQDPYPARETVCVRELPLGAPFEISMVAVK